MRLSERHKLVRGGSFRFLRVSSSSHVRKADVPGGPYIKQPLGGVIPRVLNLSACCIGSTLSSANAQFKSRVAYIASTSSSICLSNPPISVYVSVGLSSTSIALTRASYSAISSDHIDNLPSGSLSRIR